MNRRPPILAHHLIWTAYGKWLPNDPRGSGSERVLRDKLRPLEPIHFGRKAVQPASGVIRAFYKEATSRLKNPQLRFDESQIETVATGMSDAIHENQYTCYACAILCNHVHILLRRHRHRAEEMIGRLQTASRVKLYESATVVGDHPIWTDGGWKRFLHSPHAIRAVIGYIRQNLLRAGMPPQRWPFVTDYDGWSL